MSAMSAAVQQSIAAFSAQELSNTEWSLAQLRFQDVPLLQALSSQALRRLAEFKPQELANTSWALSNLR